MLGSIAIETTMDQYTDTLNSVGESILTWADPENQFRGHTNVREFHVCELKDVQVHAFDRITRILDFWRSQ
jgi:hypothetical protein